MTEPHIEVHKARGFVPYAAKLLADAEGLVEAVNEVLSYTGPPRPSPPEPGPNRYHDALLEAAIAAGSVFAELVEMHRPNGRSHWMRDGSVAVTWTCEGDEYGGYDAEPPYWPCETTAILAAHLGVDLA